MTEIPIDILFDDAAEILLPRQCGKGARRAAACVCCGLAGQAMDDDGCGICDACLDAPLQATGNSGERWWFLNGEPLNVKGRVYTLQLDKSGDYQLLVMDETGQVATVNFTLQ